MFSRYRRPSKDPRTTPSAREDWMRAAAPLEGSVRSRTVAVFCVVAITCPTTPPAPMTVSPVSTPAASPASMVTVWL